LETKRARRAKKAKKSFFALLVLFASFCPPQQVNGAGGKVSAYPARSRLVALNLLPNKRRTEGSKGKQKRQKGQSFCLFCPFCLFCFAQLQQAKPLLFKPQQV
jgi:hypothetical protein